MEIALAPPGDKKKHRKDLLSFEQSLKSSNPFQFVRFSDGEIEILRARKLEISSQGVDWSGGSSSFRYPDYDFKSFNPDTDIEIMREVMLSATFQGENYLKGVPAAHNRAGADRDLLIDLNGGLHKLTYSDLFVNSNFKHFLNQLVPVMLGRKATVIANFRASLQLENWSLIPIRDNFFQSFHEVLEDTWVRVAGLPEGNLVLSSASSLSNVLGQRVAERRPDLTFLDIGTALHHILGLGNAKRDYFTQIEPFTRKNLKSKIAFVIRGSGRFLW